MELAKLADLDLMKKVIAAKKPSIKLDGRGAEYVQAIFDSITEGSSSDVGKMLGEMLMPAGQGGPAVQRGQGPAKPAAKQPMWQRSLTISSGRKAA